MLKWLMALSLAALVASLFLFQSRDSKVLQEAAGQVQEAKGLVMGKQLNQGEFVNLSQGAPLAWQQELITGLNSAAVISYGDLFEVVAESSLRLEKIGSQFVIHLLKGGLTRKGPSRNTDVLVDGLLDPSEEIRYPLMDPKALASKPRVMTKQGEASQDQLHETFRLHQRFLEKCFIKHFERTSGNTQSGSLTLSFGIATDGRLQAPKVKQSDYQDEDFHKCVLEVASRVKIKYYSGDNYLAEIPLQFDLPR